MTICNSLLLVGNIFQYNFRFKIGQFNDNVTTEIHLWKRVSFKKDLQYRFYEHLVLQVRGSPYGIPKPASANELTLRKLCHIKLKEMRQPIPEKSGISHTT